MVLGGYMWLSYIRFFLLSSFCCLAWIQVKISSFYQSRNVLFLRPLILWFLSFRIDEDDAWEIPLWWWGGGRSGVLLVVFVTACFFCLMGFGLSLWILTFDLSRWSSWNHRSHRGLSSWRASFSLRSDKAYYDGPRESHCYVPFLFFMPKIVPVLRSKHLSRL
jgi:hypothetical protein